ncbi:MAG: DUF6228 family protein [Actinobacteria bacterium]|nr:DUF6228 family protein [Actinomycetota bacterium]
MEEEKGRSLVIGHGDVQLTLTRVSEQPGSEVVARLNGPGLDASARLPDDYAGALGEFTGFIVGLARSVEAWPDERSWRSIDDHLRISATCDATGHVKLNVSMRNKPVRSWEVTSSLALDLGELPDLGDRVIRFTEGIDNANPGVAR